MRVIDLLNKIANGEETIKQIKWYDEDFKQWDKFFAENIKYLEQFIISKLHSKAFDLNDEIEVIEEPKKIGKLMLFDFSKNYDYQTNCEDSFRDIASKLNEIIDYINKGDSNDR